MANLLRKIVKDVQDIKQIINIPEMKTQKDVIKENIKLNEAEIKKYELVQTLNLDNLISSLNKLNELTPSFFPTNELQCSSENLCKFFTQTYSKEHIENLLQTRQELQQQLDKIKLKIDKARKPST